MTTCYYLALFLSFFLIFLIFRIKRNIFFRLAENSVALLDKLLSQTDDDAKIKLIEKSNKLLIRSISEIILLVLIAFAAGSVPVAAYIFITNTALQGLDFWSFYSILSMSAGATLPFIIPPGKKNTSGYSDLSKLLHRMALNNYNLSEKLFRREKKRLKKFTLKTREDFIIISGLARAGTTSLMNDLSEIDDFISLNYSNMPFLMAPNLWAKIYKPKKENLRERSHKDGIQIGYNSNEALEEYFFKVKANDSFIKQNYLREYELSYDDYNDYLNYQSLVKNDNGKIYLAKNNNFILRYKSLRSFNDKFLMVVLFRNPLTHAASLKEKHADYSKLQIDDPFILEYMNWLGHHEFGLNQKPFSFNEKILDNSQDKSKIDFWLKNWINYYSYALTINHPNTIFVNYDDYCKHPGETIERIINKVNIAAKLPQYKSFHNPREIRENYSMELFEKAMIIYEQLKENRQ
ncbi:MAG: sulfotransferase family protein [Bacteroidota bacterium]